MAAETIQQKVFLGTEFLTWVWFRGEAGEGQFNLKDTGEFELELDTAATLVESDEADVTQAVLRGDAPGPSDLLKRAIAEGKKIQRAKFRVIWQNVIWMCQVNGETLDVSGVKLPTSSAPQGGEFGEYVQLRLETMEGFLDVWAKLYEYFLALRLDETAWRQESLRLAEWLKAELEPATT